LLDTSSAPASAALFFNARPAGAKHLETASFLAARCP
jgi:hypothetical protein